jgi:hypothetical protein
VGRVADRPLSPHSQVSAHKHAHNPVVPPDSIARRSADPAIDSQGVPPVAQSKTARASVRAGQGANGGALSVLGEYKYLIPLNGGKNVYVRNLLNGKTTRLRTDSEKFVEEVKTLAGSGHGAKIRAELESLQGAFPDHGWDITTKRLVDAGVFEA